MSQATTGPYAAAYARSLEDPAGFWGEAAKAIDWDVEPSVVLDGSDAPFYRWFPDGRSTPATTRSTATSTPGAASGSR